LGGDSQDWRKEERLEECAIQPRGDQMESVSLSSTSEVCWRRSPRWCRRLRETLSDGLTRRGYVGSRRLQPLARIGAGSWSSDRPRTWDGVGHRPACSEPVAWPPTPRTDRVAYGITPTTMEINPGDRIGLRKQPTTGGGPSLGIGRPVLDGRRGAPRDGHEDTTRHHPITGGMCTPTTVWRSPVQMARDHLTELDAGAA